MTSLWDATATQSPPETPPLAVSTRADVAIVGGGYTGLAAALALAERGASVIVLEAHTPGFGASGRNGGQVIPGLKLDPDALDRRFGETTTAFVGAAADTTFALIERLKIDCSAARTGWIQAATQRGHRGAAYARVEQWKKRGAPVEFLDADAVSKATGAKGLQGGWRDGRAGVLHPLDYARGLAKAAQAAGARVCGESLVTRIGRVDRLWRLTVERGATVEAESIVLAVNGYADPLWPALRETVLPARSCQIATAPLPPEMLARILPGGEAVSDLRRIGNYFRLGPGGRLIMGGRGPFAEPRNQRYFLFLRFALADLYPDAAELPFEFSWTGRVAVTPDRLPHLHELKPGVIAALGYNGRGVAMATALGLALGAWLLDRTQPLPLSFSKPRQFPLYGLHPVYGNWAIAFERMKDAMGM